MQPIITIKPGPIKNTPATALYAFQNGKCFYCNKYMRYTSHHPKHPGKLFGYTLDHLFPRCGGNMLAGNTVLACRKCNELKADRQPTVQEVVKAAMLYATMDRPFIASIVFP
jgi:5-methylcytosine-specific restriction endonuclease McrA